MSKKNGISFLQKGKGKDLVFFHGYLSSKEAFAAQTEYFSRFFRVTAFDFRGFGASDPLVFPYAVDDYADETFSFLSATGVEKPHVIAHSFGVRVAVKMAARDGQVFDKLLFTGPAGVIGKRGFSYRAKVKTYRVCKKLFPAFAEKHFGSAEYRTLSAVMKESYKKIVNEDLLSDAEKIENEVLIVQGREDTTTPTSSAEAYARRLKSGRTVFICGGHFAFAERPIEFNLTAEEFFR